MSKKFLHYLVKDDGSVEGTDSDAIAESASHDGSTLVINVAAGMATYEGSIEAILEADPDDWLEGEGTPDKESDDAP